METSVVVSGTVFASLWHNFSSSKGDLEGFMFGDIKNTNKSTLKDHGESMTFIEEYVIQTIDTIQPHQQLYCPADDFQIQEYILQLLEIIKKSNPNGKVIGFFRARRNSILRPSMKEKWIFNVMSKLFNAPLFLLLSEEKNTNRSILTFDYATYIKQGNNFVSLPLTISNLVSSFKDEYDALVVRSSTNYIGEDKKDEILPTSTESPSFENQYRDGLIEAEKLANTLHKSLSELRKKKKSVAALEQKLKVLQDGDVIMTIT